MSTLSIGEKKTVRVRKGQQLAVVTAASSTATVKQKARSEGDADVSSVSMVASQTKNFGPFINDEVFEISCLTGTLTEALTYVDAEDMTDIATFLGAQAAQPASGAVKLNISRVGFLYRLDFVLTAAQIPVTDAAGSGSSGSLKLFDFVQGAVIPIASRQDYTAFAEGAALTGAVGDAAFVMGLGSAAANAGDAALTGTEVDFAPVTGTITLSGGTGTGTKMGGATSLAIDGTTTANDLYLNWSGSAATIDANSTIDVTGTVTLLVAMLGDD
jgi:hypothetical protein